MKIRIKGNSLRLRLSKTDVRRLAEHGVVTEMISFGKANIVYELRSDPQTAKLHADYTGNKITVSIAKDFAGKWNDNDIISINEKQDIGNNEFLTLLVEKDFQCLDETHEDQSDNFINPNKTC